MRSLPGQVSSAARVDSIHRRTFPCQTKRRFCEPKIGCSRRGKKGKDSPCCCESSRGYAKSRGDRSRGRARSRVGDGGVGDETEREGRPRPKGGRRTGARAGMRFGDRGQDRGSVMQISFEGARPSRRRSSTLYGSRATRSSKSHTARIRPRARILLEPEGGAKVVTPSSNSSWTQRAPELHFSATLGQKP